MTPTATATATPSPTVTPTDTPRPLARAVLVGIDPGHGGRDLGARHFNADGHMDFNESQVVLEIGLRLAQLLRDRGYGVVMTRDGDYYLNDKEKLDINGDGWYDEMDQLQQRVDILNAAGADLIISLHFNAYEGEDVDEVGGTTTYYCAARPFSDQSERLAQLIQEHTLRALAETGYDSRDRGVRLDLEAGTPDEHLILLGPEDEDCARASEMPGALVESLFITNETEAQLMRQEPVLDALAAALFRAVEDYVAETASDGP